MSFRLLGYVCFRLRAKIRGLRNRLSRDMNGSIAVDRDGIGWLLRRLRGEEKCDKRCHVHHNRPSHENANESTAIAAHYLHIDSEWL